MGRNTSERKLTVPEVLPVVRAYYAKPGNGAGGSLHLVLDDGNIGTSSVVFCREYALRNNDLDGVALAELLLKMSYTQRKKLYLADKGGAPRTEFCLAFKDAAGGWKVDVDLLEKQ